MLYRVLGGCGLRCGVCVQVFCVRLSLGQIKGLPNDPLQWRFRFRTAFVQSIGVLTP